MKDDPESVIEHFKNHKPRKPDNVCKMCEMPWPCAAAVASKYLRKYLEMINAN